MPFRYSSTDAEGFAAMRMETQVGWRDVHFPGDITYVQQDGNPLQIGYNASQIDCPSKVCR